MRQLMFTTKTDAPTGTSAWAFVALEFELHTPVPADELQALRREMRLEQMLNRCADKADGEAAMRFLFPQPSDPLEAM